MKLPYLEDHRWPVSKETEERVANPGHDTQLQDHLIDEFMVALEHKDPSRIAEALKGLIDFIQGEEFDEM